MIYPKELEELIEYFKKLPGIGEKSAERLAISLLENDIDDIKSFADSMILCKEKLHNCKECGHITGNDLCSICENEYRNHNLICVVEDYKSIFAIEKMGKYNGIYHVLGGLISPMDGISPTDINIESLVSKCLANDSIELVMALRPSIEGETTTQYIKKVLEKTKTIVSRLSYGLPVGTEIDYLDALTLERAFEDRKNIS